MINKTLKQIQEENRKLIIMANNPKAKSYEEALEMELGFGCRLNFKFSDSYVRFRVNFFDKEERTLIASPLSEWKNGKFWVDEDLFKKQAEIKGKPLTLNRVLVATCERNYGIDNGEIRDSLLIYTKPYYEWLDWDLTKETLEEQSEEAQRKINELLN